MAGHSKWANTKHRKMAQDNKKGQAYAKCSREIIMATKLGGSDPAGNFRLRTAIERAKAAGLPSDNIKNAIAKGAGQGGADNMEHLTYEGYGPGGVAIYIQAVTDNRNRTAGDIRSYFNKFQGNLGESGCVGWMFEEKGQIQVANTQMSEDDLLDAALTCGANDLEWSEDDNAFVIWSDPDLLNTVCTALSEQGIAVASAEITRTPQTVVSVTEADIAKPLFRLLDAIEDHDDVQNVYANFEVDDALVSACLPG